MISRVPNHDPGQRESSGWIPSSIAALLDTRGFERLATRAIPAVLRLARAGAAAVKTRDLGAGAFLHELEASGDLSHFASFRLRRGLSRFARDLREYERADAAWEQAFFGRDRRGLDDGELHAIDRRRRRLAERVLYPRRSLGFVCRNSGVPPVRNRVIGPDEVFAHWAEELWRPRIFFRAPPPGTSIDVSRGFQRDGRREFFIRFTSPSSFLDDRVQARVIEPCDPPREIPTLIYCGGLGAVYDQVRFWPEEEYVGRRLASRGCRVVLAESPWHGRRSPSGVASGELPLAASPLGILLLISAHAQETGALVDWARGLSPVVAVGGVGLGALVAEQVAARCGEWPESFRPDAVFLNGPGLRVDRCGSHGRLLELLGLDRHLASSGWDAPHLALLRPILDPPSPPCVPPENHIVVLGRRDELLPYLGGMDLVRRWRIPDENVFTWDVGHLGLSVRLLLTDQVQDRWVSKLKRLAAWRSRARRSTLREPSTSPAPHLGRLA